jgi:hypothetical protein
MKNNVKKIAEELSSLENDYSFDDFIASLVTSTNFHDVEGPCLSITCKDVILDVWKKKSNFEIVKSVLPGASKNAGKDSRKVLSKKELLEELVKNIDNFLQ